MPSLLEALELKYFTDCDFDDCNHKTNDAAAERQLISIFIPRVSPLLCVPELLVLNDCNIDCAGDFERIKDKCQRVRELDLAQNKLQDWQEVFHILTHMPRIEFLNLSKNQLIGPIAQLNAPVISNLKSIVLNGTYLDWVCLEVLLNNLPKLEELHLSLNDYKEVLIDAMHKLDNQCYLEDNATTKTTTTTTTTNTTCNEDEDCDKNKKYRHITPHELVKTLHFTGNPIENWIEICRLGRIFPNLENLVLAECPIKSISDNDDSASIGNHEASEFENATHQYFSNLIFLNLSYANIKNWNDIDRLAMFPKLHSVRVKNWPLWNQLECTEHERRQLLIARLPNINLLNGGGIINAVEREDAERAFIRYYMEKPECERPRRYNELIVIHGKLDPLVNVNLKPDKRVKILLTYNEKSEMRYVDIYRTVGDLKLKLEKIVGLPASKMRLYYLDKDMKEHGPEQMKYPNKLLYSYNIQTGDEIIIDEKMKSV